MNEEFNESLNQAIRKVIKGPVKRYDFDSKFDEKEAKVTVEMCLRHPGCEFLIVNLNIEK